MLERFKRNDDATSTSQSGSVATAERPDAGTLSDDERVRERERDDRAARRAARHGEGAATPSALATARARQHDEFGGVNWGASFFGWLVAVGVAALLTSFLVATGAAIGLTETTESQATANAEELSLGGGIALLVVLMLAYYAGGYVAGRMSRFDGGRQGLGTWAIGLIVTVGLAVVAVVLGSEYNVLDRLNLPSLPVGSEQTLQTGGLIALAAIVIGTVLAAMSGGKVGERYHKRVDRAGFVD